MSTSFSQAITSKIRAVLSGGKKIPPEASLFAINWFDTRFAPLYHLYNVLAAPRVFRIGGKAFFKAEVTEQISGDPTLARRFLLIVNYPSAGAFLNLLRDPIFQIISLLRTSSVKNFSFCLNLRLEGDQQLKPRDPEKKPSKHTALLHFHGNIPANLQSLIQDHCLTLYFSSRKALALSIESSGKEPEHVPAITDHVLLIEADEKTHLDAFFMDPKFIELSLNWEKFFSAHLRRIL